MSPNSAPPTSSRAEALAKAGALAQLDKMAGGHYTLGESTPSSPAPSAAFVIMRYDIRERLAEPDGQAACHIDAPVPLGTGAEFVGHVTGEIRLRNLGHSVVARGRLRATAVLPCSRCLREHEAVMQFDVSEDCTLTQMDEPGSYVPDAEYQEPAPIPILDGNIVDLSELVRQLLVLSLPARSLCSPDCKGLCPECGANLNLTTCDCQREATDPRFAPLADLLQTRER